MASDKTPTEVSVNSYLEDLIKTLAKQCKEEEDPRKESRQVKWLMPPRKGPELPARPKVCDGPPGPSGPPPPPPDAWKGDPFDWEKMRYPFDSIQSSSELIKRTLVPGCVGAAGDLTLAAIQVDYLNCMERAFRARHTTSFSRGVAHHSLRRKGQGDNNGPLKYGLLDYLRDLKKVTSG
jgi:hypothetical protein